MKEESEIDLEKYHNYLHARNYLESLGYVVISSSKFSELEAQIREEHTMIQKFLGDFSLFNTKLVVIATTVDAIIKWVRENNPPVGIIFACTRVEAWIDTTLNRSENGRDNDSQNS